MSPSGDGTKNGVQMKVANQITQAGRTLFRFLSSKSLSRIAALVLVGGATVATAPAQAAPAGDAQFSSLFEAWKRLDGAQVAAAPAAAIPSRRPVEDIRLTSDFGSRSDPFTGRRRMHQGIDIPGPIGTPIYATADGIISRAEWANGYGNLVEINHGNGLQTRYGHMSKLIAQPNQRVVRGQLIGLMGSTGRSTGSHLHYEVRIAGAAVNPIPYLEGTNYELAMSAHQRVAMGGPEARKLSDNAD